MKSIVGMLVVFASILGGFWYAGGKIQALVQPAEFVIIGGSAIGAFMIAATNTTLSLVFKNMRHVFAGRHYGKQEYVAVLSLLSRLLSKARREGLASIEQDIEHPQSSPMFGRGMFEEDPKAVAFICDTFRVYLVTGEPSEIEGIMHVDIECMHAQDNVPSQNLSKVAESLPGLGIVAAVLGVVLTMQNISAPPDVLGHSIGAALLGTFLGVLLCYGLVGPMATKIENIANEKEAFFNVIRATLAGAAHGATPMIALEFGRRSVPDIYRPSFEELENLVRR